MSKSSSWDDYWNAGFDAFFDGIDLSYYTTMLDFYATAWKKGWLAAKRYKKSLDERKGQPSEDET